MSQENVEVARRLWGQLTEAAATGQSTALPDFGWDPEVEYTEDPRWPGAGVYRGTEQYRPGSRSTSTCSVEPT